MSWIQVIALLQIRVTDPLFCATKLYIQEFYVAICSLGCHPAIPGDSSGVHGKKRGGFLRIYVMDLCFCAIAAPQNVGSPILVVQPVRQDVSFNVISLI